MQAVQLQLLIKRQSYSYSYILQESVAESIRVCSKIQQMTLR